MKETETEFSTDALGKIRRELQEGRKCFEGKSTYCVPAMWLPPGSAQAASEGKVEVNPYDFYLAHIDNLLAQAGKNPLSSKAGTGGDWIRKSVIYSFSPRISSAFDHNGDGDIGGSSDDITRNRDGYRETGTFLKSLALLEHIRKIGCNVLYMLPITSIGKDGNK
jgi:hypothetical protein